jgi:hypothetical protein
VMGGVFSVSVVIGNQFGDNASIDQDFKRRLFVCAWKEGRKGDPVVGGRFPRSPEKFL